MRALHALINAPWCITEDSLKLIVQVAKRENPDVAAVEAQLGRKLEYTRTVTERGGVATIPVDGPIFRKANLFTQMSGATSLEILAKDFHAALHNPQVRAILLAIDSPGGEATGVNEFAEIVYQARGQKPIVAYVEGLGASAAYWIASACDEIVCDATAMLGSIGVVAAMDSPDNSGEEIVFVSTQSPNKRPDLRTDEGKLQVQSLIDATADVFIAAVARNRGVSTEHVEKRFGAGGLKLGADAVEAKLADRLGSYEQALAELQGRQSKPRPITASTEAPAPAAATLAGTVEIALGASAPASAAAVMGGRLDAAPALSPPSPRMPAPPARKQINNPQMEVSMSDSVDPRTPEAPAEESVVPALPPLDDTATQAQISAYVGQLEARFKAQQEDAFRRAQQEFERRMQELQAKQQIESYAQHITTPTLTRQHALPGQASAYSSFLLSLSAEQRKAAQSLFDGILSAGLVSFEEIGSSGEGEQEKNAGERWNAAVQAKVAGGMARSAAIGAVMKEQPELYREYSASAKKGGR